MVFDRAAVIAPQRPRRVSTIKTSTSGRDSLPKERRALQEEEALQRARQEEAFIHFLLICFYICGKIDSDVSLKVLLGVLPPRVPCAFFFSPLGLPTPTRPRSNLFSFHLCIEKHERSRVEARYPPGGQRRGFLRLLSARGAEFKGCSTFQPVKERSV